MFKKVKAKSKKTFLAALAILIVLITKPQVVYSQSCTCNNWDYSSSCGGSCLDNYGNPGCCSTGTCTDANNQVGMGDCTASCGPGSYVCNNGCCPYTYSTPPTGGGGTGTGGGCEGSCTDGGGSPITCSQTSPTNLSATALSQTSTRLNWTPGTAAGGSPYQALYVSTNPNPQTGCAGSSGGTATCPVKKDSSTTPIDSTQGLYDVTGLAANTVYFWQVVNVQDTNCASYANSTFASSCSVSPVSVTIGQGQSQTLTSSITSSSGISQVTFTSSSPSHVSVNPAADATYAYQTLLTGVSPIASATITQNVYETNGALICSQNVSVVVTDPLPWWQVKDSDVSSSGSLSSTIPNGLYFGLAGDGGFPGVPAYLTSTNLTNLNVSQLGWLVNSGNSSSRRYDYEYFNNQIPDDTLTTDLTSNVLDQSAIDSNISPSYGYYWYRYDGTSTGLDLLINSPIDIGSKKVIVLVKSANIDISSTINLTKGSGFFLLVAGKDGGGGKGDITIDPTLGGNAYDLEGIYVASNAFKTGSSNQTLRVRGSVVGYGAVNLERDLDSLNITTPSEYFEYAPDQTLLFPPVLGTRKINWKEVAP